MSLLCAVCLHTPPGDTDTHRARDAITIMRGLAVCEPHLELFELPGDIWDALMLTAVELAGKPRTATERTTIEAHTLRALARDLQQLAASLVALRSATTELELVPGRQVSFTFNGATATAGLMGGAAKVTDHAEARRLAESFASRRRERLTDDDLADVASIVTQAQAEGRPIQGAVAEARYCSKSRAGHLIKIARDRGFLPPVERKGGPRAKG